MCLKKSDKQKMCKYVISDLSGDREAREKGNVSQSQYLKCCKTFSFCIILQ